MSDAPFVEKPVDAASETQESKAARQRLAAVLAELDPAGGKTDRETDGPRRNNRAVAAGSAAAVGPWKAGDTLPAAKSPAIAGKALEISAEIEPEGSDGVIVTQGGGARGYALYLTGGKLAFAVREGGLLTTIVAKDPLGKGHFVVQANLHANGALALRVDGKPIAEGKTSGPIGQQPRAGLSVGSATFGVVGEYTKPDSFPGKVTNVRVTATAANR